MCKIGCACQQCKDIARQGLSDCNCKGLNDRQIGGGLRGIFSDAWNSIKGSVTKEAEEAVTNIAVGTTEKLQPVIKESCKEGAILGVKEYLPLVVGIVGSFAVAFYGAGMATQAAIYKWRAKRG